MRLDRTRCPKRQGDRGGYSHEQVYFVNYDKQLSENASSVRYKDASPRAYKLDLWLQSLVLVLGKRGWFPNANKKRNCSDLKD